MINKKIITILHEDFFPLTKGYRRACVDRLNILADEYEIDLIIPVLRIIDKYEIGLNKKINTIFFKASFFGNLIGFILSIIKFSPISVSIYSNFFYKKFINDEIKKKNYDYIYLITPRGLDNLYFKNFTNSKLIIDFIDPFSLTFLHRYNKKKILNLIYLLEYFLAKKYEFKIQKYIHKITLISKNDIKYYNYYPDKSIHVPHIVSIRNKIKTYDDRKNNAFCFSGNLSYNENVTSIDFIVKKILPILYKFNKNYEFHIIGANPKNEILKISKNKNIKLIKNPNSITNEISNYRLSISAQKIPFGVISKIPESISVGTPILTFRENIINSGILKYDDNLYAETPIDFAKKIHLCLSSKSVFESNVRNINYYGGYFSSKIVKDIMISKIFN